ncbi:NAD(P)-binding protein [Didymella exigua CBS 183.55]|uniref:NAD(P)-binding protein n=1 Tax=Didymella exigua CBS 183.55 TaxID=1150837 RepID=A0A6A5RVP6_9PLEO|nr:NAD(P)-binding protein [Didymella exigua CBS 183.55]KAF1931048.1 NAD(P)-binding protein [Didymella exigua CBS 183.55]
MSTPANPSVGWIGLGSMGLAMALNVQKHLKATESPDLHYWNRTISKGDELKEIGGKPFGSPLAVVLNSGVVFISVSDDQTLKSVVDQIVCAGQLLTGTIFVDTTTIHPETTRAVSRRLEQFGAVYIAAPVFGSTPVAQAGQLLVAAAGRKDAVNRIEPYLTGVIARGVIRVGEDPAQALLLKTTSNILTAGMMYLISEAHTLAEKSGLPSSVLESLIEQNLGTYAHGVSKRLTSGAYLPAEGQAPQSSLELGIKDVQHGVDLAKSKGMKLDVGEVYVTAANKAKEWSANQGRALDSSSVFGIVRKRAGLAFENEYVQKRDAQKRKMNDDDRIRLAYSTI